MRHAKPSASPYEDIMKPTTRLILAIGDLVALFAFVLLGQADHSTVSPRIHCSAHCPT